MSILFIIFLMIKFWPVTLILIFLFIWLLSSSDSSGSSSGSGSYSSGYYPSYSSHGYDDDDDDDYSSHSSSDYNDYYDFGPGVSSDRMYENAARLAEEDPETYAELDMGDW